MHVHMRMHAMVRMALLGLALCLHARTAAASCPLALSIAGLKAAIYAVPESASASGHPAGKAVARHGHEGPTADAQLITEAAGPQLARLAGLLDKHKRAAAGLGGLPEGTEATPELRRRLFGMPSHMPVYTPHWHHRECLPLPSPPGLTPCSFVMDYGS